jgi:hypothetical protein
MSKVIAVVEGATEQTFVREVLAPWLWDKYRVELVASAAGKPGKKGGNSYGKVKRDIVKHLNNPHFAMVTTFFDYYGMPPRWPGRKEARKRRHIDKPITVEKAIRRDIESEVGLELIARLIPYVQMHEFEALLFSETSALPEVMRKPGTKNQLDEIREEFNSPEEINDSSATAPSKRIKSIFRFYQKPLHGILAAKRITIEIMMQECPHFREWVSALGSLGGR